jgi:hypothetical protein
MTGGLGHGQFSLYKIALDGDGRIYACNLVAPLYGICFPGPPPNCLPTYLDQGPFRVYRWDTPTSTPKRIYGTLNAAATNTGILGNSEMTWTRWGDTFDVVGGRRPYTDPVTQQTRMVDSTRIFVGGATFSGQSAQNSEINVLLPDTALTVLDGLGRPLEFRLAMRIQTQPGRNLPDGFAGRTLAVTGSSPDAPIWADDRSGRRILIEQKSSAAVLDSISQDTTTGSGVAGPSRYLRSPSGLHRYLICTDGLPSTTVPTNPNFNTRARLVDVTNPTQSHRAPAFGNTPFLGQNMLTPNGAGDAYISDVAWGLYKPGIFYTHLRLFVLMSNNGIASFLSTMDLDYFIPVEFKSFHASRMDDRIILEWTVEQEQNSAGYEVQRQFADEAAWRMIGYLAAAGSGTGARAYTFSEPVTAQHRASGAVAYRIKAVETDGSSQYSPLSEIRFERALFPVLYQSYPNPANPTASISYSLPYASEVRVEIFDALGKCVRTLRQSSEEAGLHSAGVELSGLPSGIYTCQLSACGAILQKRLTVVR